MAWAMAVAAISFDASFVNASLTKPPVGLEINATPKSVGYRIVSGPVIAGVNNFALAVPVLAALRLFRRLPEGHRRFDAATLSLVALLIPAIPIALMTTYGMCEKLFQH